ncbi:hypothetical protein BH20ACT16_BH20ACT16_03830 [soil metagenome]
MSSNFTDLDFGNYRNPTIEVVKNLVPSTDAGRFDLKIDGVTEKANAGDTDTTTPRSVAIGSAHTTTETGGSAPATDLADYTTTYSCTKNGQAAQSGSGTTISVGAGALAGGDALKCTFTNTRDTTLTVIKQVDNGDGGTKSPSDWTMNVAASNPSSASFAGSSAGTTITIDPGAFSVGETAGAGVVPGSYTLRSQVGCAGTALVGQHYTCTLVNDDVAPKLTVIKTVVNKNGSTATATDFSMHINGTAGMQTFPGAASPGTTKTLVAGTYNVTETGALTSDYTEARSADCSGSLAVGDDKTCTVTNTRKTGTITVVKDLIPASDTGRFDLRIDGNVVKTDAGDGGSSGAVTVNTGTHTVSEVAGSVGDVDDYASSISCTPGGASASGRGPLNVTVTDGADITCTITNTRATTLTVVKQVDNGDGGTKVPADWTMNVTAVNPSAAQFAGSSAGTTITIDPGAFSVGETAGAGVVAGSYTLRSQVGCAGTALVGQHYTCTLVNDDVAPKLTVIKTVVNKNASTASSSDFSMHINGTAGTETFAGAASPGTTKTLVAGSYAVTETGALTSDYTASESAGCSGTLAIGDDKTCTVTNTRARRGRSRSSRT